MRELTMKEMEQVSGGLFWAGIITLPAGGAAAWLLADQYNVGNVS